jgi:hypothetical protein
VTNLREEKELVLRCPAMRSFALSLSATAFVAWCFAWHPQHLLVGVTAREAVVPWWYQASAFPPFFLMLAQVVEAHGLVQAPLG